MLFSTSDLEGHIHSLCHYIPIEMVRRRNSWPSGDYLLPIGNRGERLSAAVHETPKFSCPPGFHRVMHDYAMFEEEHLKKPEEELMASAIGLEFCQRNKYDVVDPFDEFWPKGDYCVIANGAICPPKMSEY